MERLGCLFARFYLVAEERTAVVAFRLVFGSTELDLRCLSACLDIFVSPAIWANNSTGQGEMIALLLKGNRDWPDRPRKTFSGLGTRVAFLPPTSEAMIFEVQEHRRTKEFLNAEYANSKPKRSNTAAPNCSGTLSANNVKGSDA